MILSTDGEASFASFIYQDLDNIKNFRSESEGVTNTGFDAGDRGRGVSLPNITMSVNLFRIDGGYIM